MTATVRSIDSAPFERGDHVEIAERLIAALRRAAPTVFTDGKFYQYAPKRGIFEPIDPAVLSQTVQRFAGTMVSGGKKPKPLTLRAGDVSGSITLAEAQAADPSYFDGAPGGVAFEDSFVRVTKESITQHPHSPDHRARFAYRFRYSVQKPARWLQFFDEVFRDDSDRDEKIELVQEYLGACLLGLATTFQKALFLLGDGANGKSVLTKVAEGCMLPGSVCSIPPQDIHQEYRRALLAGKLLNVVAETPEREILESEPWKAAVDGSSTTGREIRQSPFTFKPIAGHLYSCNRLPGTTDQTHGFWRRPVPVAFNRIFAEDEQNKRLPEEILAAETPAIVGWLLAGAQRALVQGALTTPPSSETAKQRWQSSADQVRAFVETRCQRLPADAPRVDGFPADQLYRAYRYWAGENGHKPMASNTFGERMRLLGLPSKSDGVVRRHPVKLSAGG